MNKIILRKFVHIFIPLLLLTNFTNNSVIQVEIPSAKSEAAYIWNTIQNISFLEKQKYQISLPKGAIINKLITKSKENKLSDNDYSELEKYIIEHVYSREDYKKGYEKIENQLPLLNNMLGTLKKTKRNWEFKTFEQYTVTLTLYGTGGSYDPEEGIITIFTTTEGKFKQYSNPANTIIHEIVHIGIQDAIVDRYKVPHALKERIVDTIVYLNFKKELPDYKIQNMGDNRIDTYLQKKENIFDLEKHVKEIMK